MGIKTIKNRYFLNVKFLLWLYLFLSTSVAVHKFLTHKLANYMTFSTSFWNMFSGVNPYYQVLEYKYSPAFCMFMAPMAVLPDWLGSIIWNAINTLILYFGVTKLKLDNNKKAFILWFVIFEYMTSIQNLQSNVMMTGLMLLAFALFEDEKTFWASFVVVALFFTKIFGAGIGLIFLFYPKKTKFVMYSVFWTAVLILVPLAIVPWDFFVVLYKSWLAVITTDFSATLGVSVMGILNLIVPVSRASIQFCGLFLLLLPLAINFKKFSDYKYRLLYVASILIWVIIFNHKAESPTFIIAVTGVALWYSVSELTPFNRVLVLLVFVFTTLSPTDLFPKIIFRWVNYNIVKALPCILVWIKIQYDL
ncbi:MAG: glycosyltransferase family 87 protein, partial [bacterium]